MRGILERGIGSLVNRHTAGPFGPEERDQPALVR